jgi:hypothetical protein
MKMKEKNLWINLKVMNSLLWRKQHNVDKILHEFVPNSVLSKYFPGGWHHNDKQGRPMFILRLGQMDIKVYFHYHLQVSTYYTTYTDAECSYLSIFTTGLASFRWLGSHCQIHIVNM